VTSDAAAHPSTGHSEPRFDVVSSEVTHTGMMTTLRVDTLRASDGSTFRREIAERLDAVAMVPMTDAGEIVLLRQYRHAVNDYELEIPAGLLDVDGESEEVAAQRELVEEIGVSAGTLRHLVRFVNSGGWSNEQTTIFVATDLRTADVDDDFVAEAEEADMSVLRMPLVDAVAMVHDGRIRDAKTVIGVLLVAADGAS
jgi:ADP-ribose pyrophosphatase